jgi:helix-turn-helix protein
MARANLYGEETPIQKAIRKDTEQEVNEIYNDLADKDLRLELAKLTQKINKLQRESYYNRY